MRPLGIIKIIDRITLTDFDVRRVRGVVCIDGTPVCHCRLTPDGAGACDPLNAQQSADELIDALARLEKIAGKPVASVASALLINGLSIRSEGRPRENGK